MNGPLFTTKSHALLVYKRKGIFAIGVIAFTTVATYLVSGTPLFPALAFLVTTMPLVNFLFPMKISLFEDHLIKDQLFYPKELPFSIYTRFQVCSDGILLIKKRGSEFIYLFDPKEREQLVESLLKLGLKNHE